MFNRLDPVVSPPADCESLPALETSNRGTSLTLPSGEIVGELRPIALDPGHTATYDLEVANGTPMPLATFAYASLRPTGGRVFWSSAMVPPDSTVSIPIEIPIRTKKWPERVIAELHTGSAHLTIEAAPPPAAKHKGPPLLFASGVALSAALLLIGAVGYVNSRPQVVALAAPDSVEGGASFSIAYALTGTSSGQYTVEAASGKEVAAGTLSGQGGSFSLSLPSGPTAEGYDLRVIARNVLGTDSRSTHVVALPEQHQPSVDVKITASLKKHTVISGDQVIVNYRTNATDGSIEIVDQQGTVRAETLLSSGGSSILIAPPVDREQDYRVVIRASNAQRTREKRLALRIAPAPAAPLLASAPVPAGPAMLPVGNPAVPAIDGIPPPAVPAAAPTVLPTGLPVTKSSPALSNQASSGEAAEPLVVVPHPADAPMHDPFALVTNRVASGATFAISILRGGRDMHLALMDMTGDEVTGVDVGAQERTVHLTAPHVPKADKYLVVATFTDAYGQETVVRPITIGGSKP